MQLDAPRRREFHGVELRRPVEPLLIDVGDHEQRRPAVFAVQHAVDACEPHRPDSGQQRHLASVPDFHVMPVGPRGHMVAGVHGADHARERLGEGCREESGTPVNEQAVHLHHLVGNDDVCGVASGVRVGIARGAHQPGRAVGIAHRRLDGELVAGLEFVPPFAAHFEYLAREFVADYDRV